MTFNPVRSSVDFVMLGGQRTPGIAMIVDADSPRRLIERNGFGLSGATVRFAGVQLSHPKLQIRLYSAQDWDDWETFRPTVMAPPLGSTPRALEVAHPILEDLGIRSVLVANVRQPVQEADGVWLITIELTEFRRPVFQLSTPDGASVGPTDPVDIQIAAMTAQVDSLAGPPGAL